MFSSLDDSGHSPAEFEHRSLSDLHATLLAELSPATFALVERRRVVFALRTLIRQFTVRMTSVRKVEAEVTMVVRIVFPIAHFAADADRTGEMFDRGIFRVDFYEQSRWTGTAVRRLFCLPASPTRWMVKMVEGESFFSVFSFCPGQMRNSSYSFSEYSKILYALTFARIT